MLTGRIFCSWRFDGGVVGDKYDTSSEAIDGVDFDVFEGVDDAIGAGGGGGALPFW